LALGHEVGQDLVHCVFVEQPCVQGSRFHFVGLTPGSLEPMHLVSLGDGYRCRTCLRDYWLKASPDLDGYARAESS
jgi:hypothetical protein